MASVRAIAIILALIAGCIGSGPKQEPKARMEVSKMRLESYFADQAMMESISTCDGADISPRLSILDLPDGTESIVLIVDDPDAPMGTWVHWVVYDIDPKKTKIFAGEVPGTEGVNDFGKTSYGGPCPPSGTHRYFFKAYALNKMLGLEKGASKVEVEKSMDGHVIDKAQLVGRYQRA